MSDDTPLTPADLELDHNDRVERLDDGRLVITPGDATTETSQPDAETDGVSESSQPAAEGDGFAEPAARYALDATLRVEGAEDHRHVTSDDVTTVFETFVRWYAEEVGDDPPPVVLGLLLSDIEGGVRYPAGVFESALAAYDLEADDSIADLVSAVRAARTFTIDP